MVNVHYLADAVEAHLASRKHGLEVVMVGHSEAVWVELERPLSADEAAEILREAPSVRVVDLPGFPTPGAAAGAAVSKIAGAPTVFTLPSTSTTASCDVA